MKKVFVQCMFGSPFPWTQQYIDHVQGLGELGWHWKIFTPHPFESKGNVEIINMTAEQFNDLVEKKTGVRPQMSISEFGVPTVHVTDFYVGTGIIFEDYLQDADFWCITNMDVVYGRLDHYLPDSVLEETDVFTDDVKTINGVFCLFRNRPDINHLFMEIPNWRQAFGQDPCPYCLKHEGNEHVMYVTDEFGLTEVMKRKHLRYSYPPYYPLHSYDRLMQHQPKPSLKVEPDGALIEIFRDPLMERMPDNILFQRGNFGREIMYFHFISTKKWPL